MNKLILNEAQRIWTEIAQHKKAGDLEIEIELYKKMLDIFQVGDYYYLIFNLPEARVEFCSDSIARVLGYKAAEISLESIFEKIHPEDLPYFVDFESTVTEFFRQLPPDKVMKYKVRYDYRIRNSAGKYIRVLQQVVAAQSDEEGALLRTLVVHTDISHLKRDNKMVLSLIGLEGEPSYIDVKPLRKFAPSKEVLTRRERDILHLLVQNKTSSEIAEALYISPNTVTTHRKNMLRKVKARSVLELVTLSLEKGWV